MRIRPGVRVTVDGPGRVRLGTGPRAHVLTGLSPDQLLTLQRLARGEPVGLPAPGTPAVAERAELLGALEPWLSSTDPAGAVPGLAGERLRADGHAWRGAAEALAPDFLAARARLGVWISGLDRCGMALALALAAAGVGRLAVPEESRVSTADLGGSPLRLTELGLPRAAALGRHVGRLYPETHVLSPVPVAEAWRGADAMVAVVRDGLDPELAALLAAAEVPVLPVVFHESGFRLGPLWLPDSGACPVCALQAWPTLQGSDEAGGGSPSAPETTSALIAAGLAAQAVLMVLDGAAEPAAARGAFVGTLGSAAVHFVPLEASCAHAAA